MTLRNLMYWFFSTLAIGVVAAFGIGWIIDVLFQQYLLEGWLQQLFLSLTLAAVAELGLFAYLVFNWLSRGMISKQSIYHGALVVFLLFVIVIWTYYTWTMYQGTDLWLHLFVILLVLVVSLGVSIWKVKLTERAAFIPTFFFMTVATVIEALPSIQSKGVEIPFFVLLHTFLILLICNAWQILMLHRWVKSKASLVNTSEKAMPKIEKKRKAAKKSKSKSKKKS